MSQILVFGINSLVKSWCKGLEYDTFEETDPHEVKDESKEDRDSIFQLQECEF